MKGNNTMNYNNMMIAYMNKTVKISDIINFALDNGLDVLMTVKTAVKAREAFINRNFDSKVETMYNLIK